MDDTEENQLTLYYRTPHVSSDQTFDRNKLKMSCTHTS